MSVISGGFCFSVISGGGFCSLAFWNMVAFLCHYQSLTT